MRVIDLPIVLAGRAIRPESDRPRHVLDYQTPVQVRIPQISEAELRAMESADRFALANLHTQEIVAFLHAVGRFWSADNIEHPLYQEALDQLSAICGFSRKMAQRELNILNVVCSTPGAIYDMLDAELGNRLYMDDWLPRCDGLLHAQPWGNVLHVMVGNVPTSSAMSIVRSLITKNSTIAKLPKRDPITALYFVLSMIEVMPDHPITRSMNIVYWPGGDPVEERFFGMTDIACVWGGEEPVRRAKALAGTGVGVLEFGPKSSFAVIGAENAGSRKVATDLAHDIAIYNQEACFSPQMVFVEGEENVPAVVENLTRALGLYERLLPKGFIAPDVHAQISRARLEAHYGGDEVHASAEGTEWSVIVISDPERINEHPLGRVIYVVPIADIRDVARYCTPSTQTVTISPWSRHPEIRDEVTLRGAAKITEIGIAASQRMGVPHDYIFPLHSLVRWVAVERGLDFWGKYIEVGPIDTTKWLMMDENRPEELEDLASS